MGLIVAGKVERLAVKRNRVKRILRDAFCQQQENIVGLDLVVRLRRSASKEDANKIRREYRALLIKLQKCCE